MAEVPRERMFRDDGGAALERVLELEDENRRLRAEVERLQIGGGGSDGPGDPNLGPTTVCLGARRSPGPFVAVVTATLCALFASALTMVGTHHSHHHRHGHVSVDVNGGIAIAPPPPLVISAPATGDTLDTRDAPSLTPVLGPPRAEGDCTVPFWLDAQGVRHYKRSCLGF